MIFDRVLGDRRHVLGLVAITLAISFGWFLLDGNITINLGDEGFLWYGMDALRRGEVPMRDFEAYDPGRYVWTAAWSYLAGDGVVSLRMACVFFQCVGVLAGLLTARRLSRNWVFLGGVALLLCAWMHPRYKVFEQSIALMAVYAGVLLREQPDLRRHWWVGVFGGLCAFVGRNHGVYHLFAIGVLIIGASLGAGSLLWLRRCAAWAVGLLVGYLPQWIMFLLVPGFLRAYLPYVQSNWSKGTNLARPVDWPWLISPYFPTWQRVAYIAEGCFYIALLAFLGLSAMRLWQMRNRATVASQVLVAAAVVSVPYTHYVFSRPDIVHLAHGAPTMTVGLIALAFTFGAVGRCVGYLLTVLLIAASLTAELSQIGFAFKLFSDNASLHTVTVRGEQMVVGRYDARALVSADYVAHKLAKPDEGVLFAPHMPGLYPYTGRRSPTTQIYFVFPATPEAEQRLIREVETANVQWAMIRDYALDGRNELRFRNTNPMLSEYVRSLFRPVPLATLPRNTVLWQRLDPAKK